MFLRKEYEEGPNEIESVLKIILPDIVNFYMSYSR
jgi:hypothetical protein